MCYGGLSFYDSVFLDFLPDMAIISGRDGSILDCNKLFFQQIGYDKKEIIGKKITELFENSLVVDKISMNLNFDERIINMKIIGINRTNDKIPMIISSNTVYDENQLPVMTVSIVKNIKNISNEVFIENPIKYNIKQIKASELLQSSIYSIYIPKEIKIHLPKKECIFNSDFEILRSIFVTIFSDSIKSMNKKGILAVGIEDNHSEIIFEIEDSRNNKIEINFSHIESILQNMNGEVTVGTNPTKIRIHIKK